MWWQTFIISGLHNLPKEREVLTFIPTLSSRIYYYRVSLCFLPLATFFRFFFIAHIQKDEEY